MTAELATIRISEDKLIISGDAVDPKEHYLPDCTEEELKCFVRAALYPVMEELANTRPWRKEI